MGLGGMKVAVQGVPGDSASLDSQGFGSVAQQSAADQSLPSSAIASAQEDQETQQLDTEAPRVQERVEAVLFKSAAYQDDFPAL